MCRPQVFLLDRGIIYANTVFMHSYVCAILLISTMLIVFLA